MTKAKLTVDDEIYEHASPERRLMMAIIVAAVCDALGRSAAVESAESKERNRQFARQWFAEKGQDFRAVCVAAGFDPDTVSASVLAYVDAQVSTTGRKHSLSLSRIAEFNRDRLAA